MTADGEPIEGTNYTHGQEVPSPSKLDCPEHCEVPPGLLLVQMVTPGTGFSMKCPLGVNGQGCGLAMRVVQHVPVDL